LSKSSRNIKYAAGTESALLFGNITDSNKSKQNARVYLSKKVSTLVYLQNKFMNGVKFVVKIIPLDGVVIGVGRQLLKMFTQT
jgi:hypothetical protein